MIKLKNVLLKFIGLKTMYPLVLHPINKIKIRNTHVKL
jgi:hypothetical protein